MIYGAIKFEKNDEPMYVQLYRSIRDAISEGRIENGEKLPSIRNLSNDIGISRSTVENAYAQLDVEGFIKSRPQSGYYACAAAHAVSGTGHMLPASDMPKKNYRYDFRSGSIDSMALDIEHWRRKVRAVLNEQENMLSYGDAQGEMTLREQLCRYAFNVRSVVTSADNIVVGAGIQPLLSILCGLIKDARKVTVLSKFNKAERIFSDFRMDIVDKPECGSGLIFVDPSDWENGEVMPVSKRIELIEYAKMNGQYIIEDDYNGELRASSRPVPSIQGMDRELVVYIGSFSKLLMPSVRLSYMVLPDALVQRYRKVKNEYNQTASKAEQLALAEYMRTGELEKQLRRSRKLYSAKCRLLLTHIGKIAEKENVTVRETSLLINVTVKGDIEKIKANAEKYGICLEGNQIGDRAMLELSYSGISSGDIPDAVELLNRSINEKEN